MTNFDTMLTEIRKMQVPIIVITNISNNSHNRHYIIIADGKKKITTFVFDDDHLSNVNSIGMDFYTAIGVYSQTVLNNSGSTFSLISH